MNPLRILLADDDADMRIWIRATLQKYAFIEEAEDGVSLLLALGERGPFDLVIADVKMPPPSGWQAVAFARTAGAEVPFLIISGQLKAEDFQVLSRLTAVEFLPKPLVPGELVAMVKRLGELSWCAKAAS